MRHINGKLSQGGWLLFWDRLDRTAWVRSWKFRLWLVHGHIHLCVCTLGCFCFGSLRSTASVKPSQFHIAYTLSLGQKHSCSQLPKRPSLYAILMRNDTFMTPWSRGGQTLPQRVVWLQVFVPTNPTHTVWPISCLKTHIHWLNEYIVVCCYLLGTKTCSLSDPQPAFEINRTHPFSKVDLDHLTMTNRVGLLDLEDGKIYACEIS